MRKLSAAVLLFLLFISPIKSGQQPEAPRATTHTVGSKMVVLGVTVTDNSYNYFTRLDQHAFIVYDNDEQQEVTFFSNSNVPLSVGIIYDASVSMTPARADEREMREGIKAGLTRLLTSGGASDEYFLIGFNQKVELLSDWTRDAESILSKIVEAKQKGQTAFYDACYMAVEKLAREARHKPVLLIVSDCEDNGSMRKFSDLRRAVKESVVQVYIVGRVMYPASSGLGPLRSPAEMDKFARETGARLYVPHKIASFREIYSYIFEELTKELRHQYTIGYRPSNFAEDGKWHRIKVKIKASRDGAGRIPKLNVRSRDGYFASGRTLSR